MDWKKAGIIAGTAVGVFLGVKYILPVMFPFFVGFLLSEAVHPAASYLANRSLNKKLHFSECAIGSVLILMFTLLIFAILFWGAEFLAEKAGDCIKYIPALWKETEELIEHCCQGVEHMVGIPAEKSSGYIYQQLETLCTYMWKQESGVETAIHSVYTCVLGIGMVMLSIVSAILFLQERGKIKAFLEQRIFYKKLMEVVKNFRRTVREYWKAQVKIMVVICLVCIVGLGFLRVKHFFVLGLTVGVLDAFPVLGTGLFFVPVGLFFLLQGKVMLGVGFFLLYLLTAIIRQFMEPRLIGNHVGVSPLLVLLSVYLGIVLYGSFGFVLGPFSALLFYGIYTCIDMFER